MYPSRKGYSQLTQAAFLLVHVVQDGMSTCRSCRFAVWTSTLIWQPDQGKDDDGTDEGDSLARSVARLAASEPGSDKENLPNFTEW